MNTSCNTGIPGRLVDAAKAVKFPLEFFTHVLGETVVPVMADFRDTRLSTETSSLIELLSLRGLLSGL